MNWLNEHILTVLILLPLAGVGFLLAARSLGNEFLKRGAFLITVLEFLLSLILFTGFEATAKFQFTEQTVWIPAWGISYSVGVDGISLFLILSDYFPNAHCSPRFMEVSGEKCHQFLCFSFDHGERYGRCFFCSRPFLFLYFLGSDIDSHVLPHRRMGLKEKNLRRNQICFVHHGGIPLYASRYPLSLQSNYGAAGEQLPWPTKT
jgi:hypothetical protein